MTGQIQGVVVEVHPEPMGGGWGFIRPVQSGTGIARAYFNASGLQQLTKRFADLQVGDRVDFTPIDHPKGPRAIEILVRT
jgi:cold shock CspA family protein